MYLRVIISSTSTLAVSFLLWCLAGFSRELFRKRDCFAWLLFIEAPSGPPVTERTAGSIIEISKGKIAA